MKRQRVHWGNPHAVTYPALSDGIVADLVIVGGGIAGVMTAFYARRYGIKNVVILEQDAIGSGSTGYSAGMLVSEIETASWKELIHHYGAQRASQYLRAQYKAFRDVRSIIKKYRIPCEAELDSLLYVGTTQKDKQVIESEHIAKRAMGAFSVRMNKSDFNDELSVPRYRFGYRFGKGLSVNPLICVRGIADMLVRSKGVRIYEQTRVLGRIGKRVITAHGTVTAQHIVYACGAWCDVPQVSSVVTSIAITAPLPRMLRKRARLQDKDMLIDTGTRSYHYAKFTRRGELLIGYGDVYVDAPQINRVHAPHRRALTRYLQQLFPENRVPIVSMWSQVYALSSGYLPYVRNTGSYSVLSGAGTQIASIVAAEYVVRAYLKRKNPLAKLFER